MIPHSKRSFRALFVIATAGAFVSLADAATSNPRVGNAFVLSGADGSTILTLNPPDMMPQALFGHAVAGIGDINGDMVPDLAVGAPGVDDGGINRSGKVYLFSGADGSLLRAISSPNRRKGGRFGFSLTAAGDLDGDGAGDLIVGAPRENDPASGRRSGVAYIVRSDPNSAFAVLVPEADPNSSTDPQKGAGFGWSLAAGVDVSGSDGKGEILVAAPGDNQKPRANSGSVYLFDGATGALIAAIRNPRPQENGLFGESVSFMADATGDGVSDILVGSDGEDAFTGDFAGRISVISGADPNVAYWNTAAPVIEPLANFGFAVAGLADINGDGLGDIAATEPESSLHGQLSGLAYVLSGDKTSGVYWTLVDPSPHRLAFFGGAMAALPDLTGDGLPEVAVGAELHRDPNAVRTGRTYVFSAATATSVLTLESPVADVCGRFGWTVAPAGDVNGDGTADIIVGAPYQRPSPVYRDADCF